MNSKAGCHGQNIVLYEKPEQQNSEKLILVQVIRDVKILLTCKFSISTEAAMQTSETGSDTGSTVTLQTSVAGQAAVPTQVVQQLPVQQQVGHCLFSIKCKEVSFPPSGFVMSLSYIMQTQRAQFLTILLKQLYKTSLQITNYLGSSYPPHTSFFKLLSSFNL